MKNRSREGFFKLKKNQIAADAKDRLSSKLSNQIKKPTFFNYEQLKDEIAEEERDKKEMEAIWRERERNGDDLDVVKITVESKAASKPTLPFKIIKQEDHTFIFSDDIGFLEKTMDALIKYSENVSPDLFISKQAISPTPENFQKQLGLPAYAICGNDFLPSWLNANMKIKSPVWATCCFSYGYFASGLSPMSAENFIVGDHVSTLISTASLADFSPGDYVEIRIKKGLAKHGFTYISPDICLSANGRNKPFEFYPARDVLTTYGCAEDSLINPTQKIAVYRKIKEFNYPENIKHILTKIAINPEGSMDFLEDLKPLSKFMMSNKSIYAQEILKNFDPKCSTNFLSAGSIRNIVIELNRCYVADVAEQEIEKIPSFKSS